MSTPEFVLELRKKIGHDLLWLNGVTGCVLNEHGQLLLGRRSDTGEWAMVYGINEPGEQPADTVVREIKEETGIDAIVTDLVAVTSSNKVLTYANGDNTMYMDHSFLCALKPGGRIGNVNYLGSGEYVRIPRADWGVGMGHKQISGGLMPGGRRQMERLSALLTNGRLDVKPLITHVFDGWDSLPQALQLMKDKPQDLIKPVVRL